MKRINPATDLRDRLCMAVASLLTICIGLLLASTGGCGSTQAGGSVTVEGERLAFELGGDSEEGLCGEFELRKQPFGIVACYDPDGKKVRVCASWAGLELLCLPLGGA